MQKIRFELGRSRSKADVGRNSVTQASARNSEIRTLHISSDRSDSGRQILRFHVVSNSAYEGSERKVPYIGERDALVDVDIDFHIFSEFSPSFALYAASKPIEIRDSVVAELSLGLFHLSPEEDVSSQAVDSMVCLLCERLSCALDSCELLSIRSFRNWQSVEIAQVLSDRLGEDVPVETIAARCRLSVCHFARLFKAVYGMPFHRFRVCERIRTAQTRLAFSEDAISSIALDCGFSDQACLTRRFTSMTGVSPAAWRKRARNYQNISVLPLGRLTLDCQIESYEH
jgi:AraC-like DNA-binding protein